MKTENTVETLTHDLSDSIHAHGYDTSNVRLLVAIPVGLIIAIALFSFMSWMVGGVKEASTDEQAPMSFDVVMQDSGSGSQARQRQLPEAPKMPEQPQMATPTTPSAPTPQVQAPQVTMDMNMTLADNGVAIDMPTVTTAKVADTPAPVAAAAVASGSSAPAGPAGVNVGGDIGGQSDAMPLYRAEPAYPPRMLRRKIEGFVVMKFTINEQGRPEDIQLVQAEPSQAFVRPAMQALRNWKYQPKVVNGQAVKQSGQQVKIEFKINK
ncbi:MAG: energy transducer TonB [Vibrio sp.]